ncbi:MAG: GTPase Era [Candidatus Latescibacteria bacterium]|nr:GTPase Era [Candidatus Latescibacterota bacterium]
MKNLSIKNKKHVCGYVAVVGLPNAGKSTLMNHYLKRKVSIVTPKPQTTRENVTCILSADDYQIIFIDTPGILRPRYRMQEVMTSFISKAVDDSDIILAMIDAAEIKNSLHPDITEFARRLKHGNVIVVINKIDKIKKQKILELIQLITEMFPDAEIIPISALDGDGTEELLSVIISKLPEGPSLYPEDIISFEPERFFVSELIRETVFLSTNREIPYSSAVMIDNFEEKTSLVVIHATILVEKKSQKPIIIGKDGSMIKKIGIMAREAIEEFLERNVYLDLHVKVRNDWRNKDVHLRELGLIKGK